MAFRFKQSSCVVAGTFNIYVVQPSLLIELGIVPSDDRTTQISFNLKQPALKFSAEALPGVSWTVTPEQLVVESSQTDSEYGELVARVLRAIRYTPLRAIGTNLVLSADADDVPHLTKKLFYDTPPIPGAETFARTVHVAVRQSNTAFNCQVQLNTGTIELSLNVHTDMPAAKPQEVNESAATAAQQFQDRISKAVDIARTLYGIEIDYARNPHVH